MGFLPRVASRLSGTIAILSASVLCAPQGKHSFQISSYYVSIAIYPSASSHDPHVIHVTLRNQTNSAQILDNFVLSMGDGEGRGCTGGGWEGPQYSAHMSFETKQTLRPVTSEGQRWEYPISRLKLAPHEEIEFDVNLKNLRWENPESSSAPRSLLAFHAIKRGKYILIASVSLQGDVWTESNGVLFEVPAPPKNLDFRKTVSIPQCPMF